MSGKESKWKSLSIPDEMMEKIQKIIEQNPDLGFKSAGQFLVAALRDYKCYNIPVKEEPEKKQDSGPPRARLG